MDISELARLYAALPPSERALFAAMVRAHQAFNAPGWQVSLAARHREIDESGGGLRFREIEDLFETVGIRSPTA